jgi:hypothetical protein
MCLPHHTIADQMYLHSSVLLSVSCSLVPSSLRRDFCRVVNNPGLAHFVHAHEFVWHAPSVDHETIATIPIGFECWIYDPNGRTNGTGPSHIPILPHAWSRVPTNS